MPNGTNSSAANHRQPLSNVWHGWGSSTRQVAEEVSEPVYRKGGLFDKEDDSFIGISDEQVVREGLYDENGEISHELLEERLDREIRQSINSLS